VIETEIKAEFEAKVAEKLSRLARSICSGGCKSMDEYRYKCGEIYAWEHSVDLLSKIVQESQMDEDDDLNEEAT